MTTETLDNVPAILAAATSLLAALALLIRALRGLAAPSDDDSGS